MSKVHDLGFELLLQPPYSPDLSPSDFFLFPNLKIWHRGKRFPSDEEVIAAVDEYFRGFETSYFSEGIKKLEEHWMKCAEAEGDYVENFKTILHKKSIFIYFLPYLLNDPRTL